MAWAEELVTRFSFDDLEEEDHIEQVRSTETCMRSTETCIQKFDIATD